MGIWQWIEKIFGDGEDGLTEKQLIRLENFAEAVKAATAREVIYCLQRVMASRYLCWRKSIVSSCPKIVSILKKACCKYG